MKKYSIGLLLLFLINCFTFTGSAQDRTLSFTLNDVIRIMAKHRFRGNYWEYRTHKAKFRPSLALAGTLPDLNRSIDKITLPDGTDAFVERSLATYAVSASLRQNIAPTGGSIFMSSELQRIDLHTANEA